MDWNVLRNWPRWLGCAAALALLLSLLSFDLQDPTLTNLRWPSTGVANWLGLPGALVGGSLLELLGSAALAAPLLLLNWVLAPGDRPPSHRYAAWSAGLLLALAGLHGLAVPPGDPALWGPGLVGWALRHWAGLTLGPWGAALVLVYLAAVCLARTAYAPPLRAAARTARANAGKQLHGAGFALGEWLWRTPRAAAAGVRSVARALSAGLDATAATLLYAPRAMRARLGAGLAALPHRGTRPQARALPASDSYATRAAQVAAPTWGAPSDEANPFAAWLGRPAPVELDEALAPARPPTRAMPATPEVAPPESEPPVLDPPVTTQARERALETYVHAALHPSEPAARPEDPSVETLLKQAARGLAYEFDQPAAQAAWRERFQRYARNLDLDWEEQVWRRGEAERAVEPDDESDPEP